jgi:hypothetical protein
MVFLSDYIVAFAIANVFVLSKLIAELLRFSENFCFFYLLLHDPFGRNWLIGSTRARKVEKCMLVDMMPTQQCFLEQPNFMLGRIN